MEQGQLPPHGYLMQRATTLQQRKITIVFSFITIVQHALVACTTTGVKHATCHTAKQYERTAS
jgi:hypothetical protein